MPGSKREAERSRGGPNLPGIVALIALLAVLAVAAGAAAERVAPGVADASFGEFLGYGALLALSSYLFLRIQFRTDTMTVDAFEAAAAPLVFTFAGLEYIALVAVAVAVAEVVRRNQPLKAIFNVAQWAAAVAIGSLLFSVLGGHEQGASERVAALGAAVLAIGAVNSVAFSAVLSLAARQPFGGVLRQNLPALGVNQAVNLPFAFLFAAASGYSSVMIPLFVVPIALLHWAGRGYAAVRADHVRLAALQRATTELAHEVDPRCAFDSFLATVRSCFESEAVELVLSLDGELVVYRDGAAGTGDESALTEELLQVSEPTRVDKGSSHKLVDALERAGWRDLIAVPLFNESTRVGFLASFDRGGLEGFEAGEIAVLDALGREVLAALNRAHLLNEVLDERRKLGDIVGSTSDGIFSVGSDGTVTSWNAAMEKITGHRAEDMMGTAHLSVLRTRDADGNDILLEGWSLANDLPTEIQVTTKAGTVRWLDCSYSKTGGFDPSLIVVARDTTATRELDQMRREFVATASHELRTPIAPIKGFAHLLLNKGDQISEVERRTGLEVILRQAQRLERLAENILSVARIDGVEPTATVGQLELDDVVSKTVGEYRVTWADRKFPLDAEHVRGIGNPVWVEQVLANLLSNAVRYSPPGSPVAVSVRGRGDRVDISVADDGPGIPDDAIDRIFDRFVRLDRDDTQAGSGLGLYIARQLAERMGGSLSARNRDVGGAVFTLSLPMETTGAVAC